MTFPITIDQSCIPAYRKVAHSALAKALNGAFFDQARVSRDEEPQPIDTDGGVREAKPRSEFGVYARLFFGLEQACRSNADSKYDLPMSPEGMWEFLTRVSEPSDKDVREAAAILEVSEEIARAGLMNAQASESERRLAHSAGVLHAVDYYSQQGSINEAWDELYPHEQKELLEKALDSVMAEVTRLVSGGYVFRMPKLMSKVVLLKAEAKELVEHIRSFPDDDNSIAA